MELANSLPKCVGDDADHWRRASRAPATEDPAGSGDPIEAVLRAAIENLGSALGTYQSNCSTGEVHLYGDDRALWTALSPLVGGALHEVAVSGQELAAFGATRGELYVLLGELQKRQLSVRLLCPPCTLMPTRIRSQLSELSRGGVDIRVARRLGFSVAVIDGRFLALGGQHSPQGAAVPRVIIREPALARAVRELLVRVHSGARPIDGFLRYESSDKAELMVAILASLSMGSKDASAARDLGLSVRTYRRRVADALSWLEVGSRFEAGVRAAELGLVKSGADEQGRAGHLALAQPHPPA